MKGNKMNPQTCKDCGVSEGQLHKSGCDMERCPFCGNQLISCDCCYEHLGFNPDNLPTNIYENGLTDKLAEKWIDILNNKGRVPCIIYPNLCGRCGKLWPNFFMVDDKEWEKYIEISARDKVLCRECYDEIKQLINNGKQNE